MPKILFSPYNDMRRWICAAAMTAAICLPAPAQQRELTVMTYTLRYGELATMERLAEEIRGAEPDFVALQEVDVDCHRKDAPLNSGVNYINELAHLTGMFGFYGRALTRDDGGLYGIGLLSRYPAVRVEKMDLPNPQDVEPRVMLEGVFEVDSLRLGFSCAHLDWQHAEDRAEQARAIADRLSRSPIPAIVAGDFNATPDEPAYSIMTSAAADLTDTVPTYPAKRPREKLDYIFAFPADSFQLLHTFVPEPSPTAPSDHLPVVSRIRVRF